MVHSVVIFTLPIDSMASTVERSTESSSSISSSCGLIGVGAATVLGKSSLAHAPGSAFFILISTFDGSIEAVLLSTLITCSITKSLYKYYSLIPLGNIKSRRLEGYIYSAMDLLVQIRPLLKLTPLSSRSNSNAASPSSRKTNFVLSRIGFIFTKLSTGSYFLAYTLTITLSGVWCQSHRHLTVPAAELWKLKSLGTLLILLDIR